MKLYLPALIVFATVFMLALPLPSVSGSGLVNERISRLEIESQRHDDIDQQLRSHVEEMSREERAQEQRLSSLEADDNVFRFVLKVLAVVFPVLFSGALTVALWLANKRGKEAQQRHEALQKVLDTVGTDMSIVKALIDRQLPEAHP